MADGRAETKAESAFLLDHRSSAIARFFGGIHLNRGTSGIDPISE
jgi:hypothetical protein